MYSGDIILPRFYSQYTCPVSRSLVSNYSTRENLRYILHVGEKRSQNLTMTTHANVSHLSWIHAERAQASNTWCTSDVFIKFDSVANVVRGRRHDNLEQCLEKYANFFLATRNPFLQTPLVFSLRASVSTPLTSPLTNSFDHYEQY